MEDTVKFTIALEPSALSWVDEQVTEQFGSRRDFFRALVARAMAGEVSLPEPQQNDVANQGRGLPDPVGGRIQELPEDPKERFLALVGVLYSVELAAHEAGVTTEQVEKWARTAKFHDRVHQAQRLYVQRIECDLVAIGRGQVKRGNASAMRAFLEAHDDNYGIVRKQFLAKVLSEFGERIHKVLREELGEGSHALLRVGKRFGVEVKRVLSRLT